MTDYRRWLGAFACFILVSMIFVVLKGGVTGGDPEEYRLSAPRGDTGLLLYIVPGLIASYLSRGQRVLNPFIGALLAVLLCMLGRRYFAVGAQAPLLQEIAYAASAVCWCMFGAFVYLFALSCLRRRVSS